MSFLLEENTFQHHLKSVSDIFLQIVQDYESVLRLASNQFFEWFRLNGMDNANPEIMQCLLSIVDFLDQNNQLNESFSTPNFHKSMVNHILNPDVIVSSCALGILYSTIKNDKLKKEIFCESNIDQLCKLILNVVHRELGSEFFQNELILLLKKFKDHDWINQHSYLLVINVSLFVKRQIHRSSLSR
ncbi:hypothetical protein BC833DRAFT_262792 [Globomyces pollinis-pini]|nr:hypothetical protein BC833DRAFT_262792 [Globomyces pollinis-pini]